VSNFCIVILLTTFIGLISCNSEQEEQSITQTQVNESARTIEPRIKPLVISKNLKKDDEDAIKLSVRIYEAQQLGLGKYYNNRNQLNDATLLADLSVTNKPHVDSIIGGEDDDTYLLKSSIYSYTNTQVKTLLLAVNYLELSFHFEENVKIGSSRFMEHSMENDTSKVYVYEITINQPGEGGGNDK